MVTNLMQLYVLPEAGQVEVLKVKVQRIYVPINLIMIFILFYFFFSAKHFYKHCLSPYFPMRSYFNNIITGHYIRWPTSAMAKLTFPRPTLLFYCKTYFCACHQHLVSLKQGTGIREWETETL